MRRQDGWLAGADVAAGVAFLVAGWLSPGPHRQRLLVAGVGAAWLLASLLPVTGLHRVLLLVMLLAFPRGRLQTSGAVLAVGSAPMALGLAGLAWDAVAFAAGAALRWPRSESRREGSWTWYPTVGAGSVAVVLALAAAPAVRGAAQVETLFQAYLGVLVAIAAAHPFAARQADTALDDQLARLVGLVEPIGSQDAIGRLSRLLVSALGDPELDVTRTAARTGPGAAESGHAVLVSDAHGATVQVRSDALADRATAAAVERAVRLALTAERAQEAQEALLHELTQGRDRLVAASDRERAAVATQLRGSVLPRLEHAGTTIAGLARSVADLGDPALEVARSEVAAAADELLDLVEGIPPADLASGGLAPALAAMAARSPIPLHLHLHLHDHGEHGPDGAVASAAFYVCSEAVANVIKHAGARRIDVTLTQAPDLLEVSVADDGRGGADPEGPGLSGISARVHGMGGTMEVLSPPDGGTQLRAVLPIRATSSMAAPPPGLLVDEDLPPDALGGDPGYPRGRGPDAGTGHGRGSGSTAHLVVAGGASGSATAAGLTTTLLLGGTAAALLSAPPSQTMWSWSALPGQVPLVLMAITLAVVTVAVGVAWRERWSAVRSGLLLAGTGALLPYWAIAPWCPPEAGAAAVACAPLAIGGAVLVFSGWRPGARPAWVWGTVALAATASVVHLLGYDPFADPGCRFLCDDISPVGAAMLTSRQAVALSCALAIGAAALGALGVMHAAGRMGTPTPVRLGVTSALILCALAALGRALSWSSLGTPWPPRLMLLAVLLVSASVLTVAGRVWRGRRRVNRLVQELSAAGSDASTMAFDVQFRSPDGGWVDVHGLPVPALGRSADPADPVSVGPEIRLMIPPGAERPTRLPISALMVLADARALALTRAHQQRVIASRAEVVSRSDTERRRIERDLHDGAQQRLVSATLHLSIARPGIPAGRQRDLELAAHDLRAAVAELREISHGIYPRVLDTEGLAPALAELATASPGQVLIRTELGERQIPQGSAMATYRFVDTMVRTVASVGGTVDIAVRAVDGRVLLAGVAEVDDPDLLGGEITDCMDRVRAVGGGIQAEMTKAGFTVTGELPCES